MRDKVTSEVYRATERRARLVVDANSGVRLNLAPMATLTDGTEAMASWPRPPEHATHQGVVLNTSIPATTLKPMILLMWLENSATQRSLTTEENSILRTWYGLNSNCDVVFFTNLQVVGNDSFMVVPFQDLQIPVTFPIGSEMYDFVDYAKVKMLAWAFQHKCSACMVADFPKLKPLTINRDMWTTPNFVVGDGRSTEGSGYARLENWLYVAKFIHKPRIDAFLKICDKLLLEIESNSKIAHMKSGLSTAIVGGFPEFMQDDTYSEEDLELYIKYNIVTVMFEKLKLQDHGWKIPTSSNFSEFISMELPVYEES